MPGKRMPISIERPGNDQIQVQRPATRANEGAFCQLGGTIFTQSGAWEYPQMTLLDDGNFFLEPGVTFSGTFFINYVPGGDEPSQYLYSLENRTPIGEPVECSQQGGFYFTIPKGDYKFIFNPEEMTITVQGEILPADYYIGGSFSYYDLRYPDYQLIPEGNDNYSLTIEGVITSGFVISDGSWYEFWASDDEENVLEAGQPFQTDPQGKWYIYLPENVEIVNPTIKFNTSTGILTIDGEYQEPEYAYRVRGALYNYDQYAYDMTEQEDGTWMYETEGQTMDTYFDIQLINKNTGQALYAYYWMDPSTSGYIVLDEPMALGSNGYSFYIHPGTYKIVLNPDDMTITVSGEIAPPGYYFENLTIGYQNLMEETEEGSGIYFTHMDFLPSGFDIHSSYGEFFGSNGEVMIPGTSYTVAPSGYERNPIYTQNDVNFVGAYIIYDSKTGELNITAQEVTEPDPAWALYGPVFGEDRMHVDFNEEGNGIYTAKNVNIVLDSWLMVIKYDLTTGYIYTQYGPMYDYTPLELNEAYPLYSNYNWLMPQPGVYDFTFSESSMTLVATEPGEEINSLYVSADQTPRRFPDGALVNLTITNLMDPQADSYTVICVNEETLEATEIEVESSTPVITIDNLVPETDYRYVISVKYEDGENTYVSNEVLVTFTTPQLSINVGTNFQEVTEDSITFWYMLASYTLEDLEYTLHYSIDEGTIDVDWEKAETLDYESVALEDVYGTFTVNDLKPSTQYVIYYYFTTELDGKPYKSAYYCVWASTQTSGVDSILDSNSEAVYYNLNGLRVNNPGKGLYIEVKDGKSRKVYFNK